MISKSNDNKVKKSSPIGRHFTLCGKRSVTQRVYRRRCFCYNAKKIGRGDFKKMGVRSGIKKRCIYALPAAFMLAWLLCGCANTKSSEMTDAQTSVEESKTTKPEETVPVKQTEEDAEAFKKLEIKGYLTFGDTITVSGGPKDAEFVWKRSYVTFSGTSVSTPIKKTTEDILPENGREHKTTEEDEETFVSVCVKGDEEGEKYGSIELYISRLPVMYVYSKDYEYKSYRLDRMDRNLSDHHEVEMVLTGGERYKDKAVFYDGGAELKVRGNSTASRPKTPFKLKLSEKKDLLGLGGGIESKHWVLLANDIDHSLMRNKLLYDFSGDIGTEFYFSSENIALVYNGEYEGVYQLCEQRRIDEGRIDITDWEEIGEDIAASVAKYEAGDDKDAEKALKDKLDLAMHSDYEWLDTGKVTIDQGGKSITFDLRDDKYDAEPLPAPDGGYVAEMDFYSMDSTILPTIKTAYLQPLYISLPEIGDGSMSTVNAVKSFKKTEMYKNAVEMIQSFEYALHSPNLVFRNEDKKKKVTNPGSYNESAGWRSVTEDAEFVSDKYDGLHYSEIFDLDSLVTNFIFVEYAMNWDSMKNSFFFYKDNDELAKIGPQWDFDWCWGNVNMYGIYTSFPTKWHTTIEYFTNEKAYQSYQWNRLLIKDPFFLTRAYEKYQSIRPVIENMIKDGGLIDEYSKYLSKAGEANDRRWGFTYLSSKYYAFGSNPQNFENSVKSIKTFLEKRVEWLDANFSSVGKLTGALGYYREYDGIDSPMVLTEENKIKASVRVTDPLCKEVEFSLNGVNTQTAEVKDGMAACEFERKCLDDEGRINVLIAYEKDGDYLENEKLKPSANYEYIARSSYSLFDENGNKIDK